MNRTLIIPAACIIILSACNSGQEQRTRNTADSLQREMEQEMDTAARKIDSLGDTIKDATRDFLNEAGETLEKAGEELKDTGN